MKKCLVSQSVICLDMLHLEEQVRELEEAGCDMLHIDIIDGYFSPSMPLGLETVRQLRKITNLPFDVHLMVKNQKYFVDELLDIGIQSLVFHIEEEPHADWLLTYIKSHGVKAGVALKPQTSFSSIDYVIERCDIILLMLINPGYASNKAEKKVPYAYKKIEDLSQLLCEKKLNIDVAVDGRISLDDVLRYGYEKVDIFVAGTTIADKENLQASYKKVSDLKKQIRNRL